MNRNLLILTLSQIFSFTAAPVTVFLSGIIGSQISPLKSLSTLPMSISVVGIAIGAIFATKVMSLIGRKAGFISASIGNFLVSILAAYSITVSYTHLTLPTKRIVQISVVAVSLKKKIPKSKLKIFKGCGHNVHLEEPQKFNETVKNFLS